MPILFERQDHWTCELTAFLVRSVARAAGRDNVRILDTREQCERWLLSGDE